MKPDDRLQWIAFGVGMTASVLLVLATAALVGPAGLGATALPLLVGAHGLFGLALGLLRPRLVLGASIGVAFVWCLHGLRALSAGPLVSLTFVQAAVWSGATMAGGALAWLATRAWRRLRQRGP